MQSSVLSLKKCPSCSSNSIDEVSYDETALDIKHVSYVMASGNKIRGQVRTFICADCSHIMQYIMP